VTKIDVPEAKEAGEVFRKAMARRKKPVTVHLLSSATGEGLDGLLDAVARVLFKELAPKRAGAGRRLGKPRAQKSRAAK
jgi:GTPase